MSPLRRTAHTITSDGSGILEAADEEEEAAVDEAAADDEAAAAAAGDSDENEAGAALLACAEQNWAALKTRLMAREIRRHASRSSGLIRENGTSR